MGWLVAFYAITMLIVSMYGGGFATIPAYLADLFGTKFVGGIHGRLLTAWSTAGIVGTLTLSSLREYSRRQAIGELARQVDPAAFAEKFGASISQLPDLVQKVLKGQDPLHILGAGSQVRCYTYGGDLARGIVTAMLHPAAANEDFNLSTPAATTVLELAELIWRKVHGGARPFRHVSDPPFPHDVQRRIPDTRKAREVLGFEAATSLSEVLDEVIPWVDQEIAEGRI